MSVEIVRDGRGRPIAVRDESGEQPIFRDARGRIAGIKGQSHVERVMAGAIDALAANTAQLAKQVSTLLENREELTKQVSALEKRLLDAVRGWQEWNDRLLAHPGNIAAVARAHGARYHVKVRWMSEDDPKRSWALGYRAANGPTLSEHVIVIRQNMTAEQTDAVIRHELVHCAQVERLLDKFDEVYLADGGEALEQEAERLGTTIRMDLPLVRSIAP